MSEIFPPLNIIIPEKWVLHLIGYRKRSSEIPEKVKSSINREINIGSELLRFKGIYLKSKAQVNTNAVSLDNGYSISSARFAKWINGCDYMYIFVVTAGPLFSERVAQLLEMKEVSLAMTADAVGSAAAEACAEAADRYINKLENGNRLTKRYSPGYGDWDVADNRRLLEVLGANKIGISVNEGGIMLPEKSVSAAIGVRIGIGNWELGIRN